MTAFLMIFRRFPTTLRRFPKILQNCSEGQTNVPEHFPKISEKFRKDFRRLTKTFEGDPKMYRWYTNEFKYNLRDKRDITEIIDIFTCEDIVSFLSICYHPLYHWLLYNKKGYGQYIHGYDKSIKGYFKYITGYDKYTKDFLEKIFTAMTNIFTAMPKNIYGFCVHCINDQWS